MPRKRQRIIVQEIDDDRSDSHAGTGVALLAAAPPADAVGAEVFVKATLPGTIGSALQRWRLRLLAEAEHLGEVRRGTREDDGTIKLTIGPIELLGRGDSADSERAVALLWCFACLAAEEDDEPEITADEEEAVLKLLKAELSMLDGPSHPLFGADKAKGGGVSDLWRRQVLRGAVKAVQRFCSQDDSAAAAVPVAGNLTDTYRQVHLSRSAVLSATECTAVVAAAEAHANKHSGWTTCRHAAYPTHDIPVYSLAPPAGTQLVSSIETRLMPELAERFGLDLSLLQIQDLFVAKYSAAKGGLPALEAHTDGSAFSFVVALNNRKKYEGAF